MVLQSTYVDIVVITPQRHSSLESCGKDRSYQQTTSDSSPKSLLVDRVSLRRSQPTGVRKLRTGYSGLPVVVIGRSCQINPQPSGRRHCVTDTGGFESPNLLTQCYLEHWVWVSGLLASNKRAGRCFFNGRELETSLIYSKSLLSKRQIFIKNFVELK